MNEEIAPPKMPPMPERIAKLPRNARGYPVPHFVAWINGVPDFRMVRSETVHECVKYNKCWICGEELGASQTFVIGPMCAVNRNSAEPPSHRSCAEFAVQACPFMLRPEMERREDERTRAHDVNTPGLMIKRNPGAMACWTTKKWETTRDPLGKTLFNIGKPSHVSWWREGRKATLEEVQHSINTGLPILLSVCEGEKEEMEVLMAAAKTMNLVRETI